MGSGLKANSNLDSHAASAGGAGQACPTAALSNLPPSPADRLVENQIAEQFVVELAKALHQAGMASDELEQNVGQLAEQLQLEIGVFATPTSIFLAFGGPEQCRTILLRVTPSEIDLGRLNELQALQRDVVQQRLNLREARVQLPLVLAQSPPYGFWLNCLAFAWASAAATLLFRGGMNEWLVTLGIGAVLGSGQGLAQRWPRLQRTFPPLCALLAALLPYFVGIWLQPLSIEIVTLGSLIVLLPGLTLTIAINELATQNLAAGTARLFGALVLLMTLGFGVALGTSLGQRLTATSTGVLPLESGQLLYFIAVATAPSAFAVLFRAHVRDFLWITLTCLAGFGIARGAGLLIAPLVSGAVGAFSVGLIGTAYSRWTQRPVATLTVPGLMFLVPGSVGFRGIQMLLNDDVTSAVRGAFEMFMVAVSLVSGLLVAYSLFPASRPATRP